MKEKIHYVIEGALGIAVIVLFALFFSNNQKIDLSGTSSLDSGSYAGSLLPIAYVNVDSLTQKYQYSIDLSEQIARKFENSHANLTEKLRKLQSEAVDFQRKVDTRSFLSEERALAEQQRLVKKQEDLQQLEAQLSKELGDEQLRLNEDLRKTIITQLKEFNKNKSYHIIFGNMRDDILYANDIYDITNEVIDFLNKNYTSTQEETSKTTAVAPTAKTTPAK
ncbi:MAG: OmpH family outer membrane protein [Tannerella sp.]|jgi:outer membrane protein|nr:OmpH family outer membrane protein [Tannerella sp.]